jgi:hypothetical protein
MWAQITPANIEEVMGEEDYEVKDNKKTKKTKSVKKANKVTKTKKVAVKVAEIKDA